MSNIVLEAYNDDLPYVFVSYAHKDSYSVLPIISTLQDNGYRVWFDQGIEAGSEWPAFIAERLKNCSKVIAFVSNAFVESRNCRNEINYALNLNKEMLVVYLEQTELMYGLELQLVSSQALYKYKLATDTVFFSQLFDAKLLGDCCASKMYPYATVESVGQTTITEDFREKDDVLEPLDWYNIFCKNQQVRLLFEVAIPVALEKQGRLVTFEPGDPNYTCEYVEKHREDELDAALGHVFYKSVNELVDKNFIKAIANKTGHHDDLQRIILDASVSTGDFVAFLTNLKQNSLAIFEIAGKMRKELYEICLKALSAYLLTVTIGKGSTARHVEMDLPVFTAIIIIKNEEYFPKKLLDCDGTKIDFSFSNEELFEFRIREEAAKQNILLTGKTLAFLESHLSFQNVKSAIKYIADYLFLHSDVQQPISCDVIRKLIGNVFS
ncbi:MAG: TIR domain-containing protein [Clostridia bacterium]|nr:TIR domain-containing protein [Clostridia bacterium]